MCPLLSGGQIRNGVIQGEQIPWLPEARSCPFCFIPFLLSGCSSPGCSSRGARGNHRNRLKGQLGSSYFWKPEADLLGLLPAVTNKLCAFIGRVRSESGHLQSHDR